MWIYRSMIDPALPLERKERRIIERAAWRRWIRKPSNAVQYSAAIVLAVIIFQFLPEAIDGLLGGHRWWHTVLAFAIYIGLLLAFIRALLAYGLAPCMYRELRGRGYDICPKCGYWLRDLGPEIGRCPECGAERKPLESHPPPSGVAPP